ncbi:uncharacterized protein LOC125185120 [Salvia hispanica]|uniref:uncharacterized protein LOC125185120 n=1 Tax=Salvia hispanica TaxID=49212 RepID=UPI00200983FA|nr:uncharacterized protein LOC125185120 [Salvia hispanica]
MEDESFTHMCHEHPLSLIPDSDRKESYRYRSWCYGCGRYFLPGDATYGCSLKCGFDLLLHKECMEMPREIMHPIHPAHSLALRATYGFKECAICKWDGKWHLNYRCSQGSCDGFLIHLGCAGGLNDKDSAQPVLNHPSHPQHELRFSKKTRWCPFPCDACGATEKGDSYTCTICDYSIHESCALLPASTEFPRHHPAHSLSLAFDVPSVYIEYQFECAICNKTLPLRRWVYHCNLCSYVVHTNCANSMFDNENANAIDDEKEITTTIFPIAVDDMYEEMIRPFVKRQKEQILIPSDHDNHNIGGNDEDCDFNIDIKCASIPNTIKHAAHPRHNHLKLELVTEDNIWADVCAGCFKLISPVWSIVGQYRCSGCRFSVCANCVMLPARNKHRSEKHLLSLTYDAYVNRPGDFYCSSCEDQMINPRMWMYHCRDCDQSFHPGCFPATSGQYKNINFGTQQYVISSSHDPHHRLRFQIITKKKRCDLCHHDSYRISDWRTYYHKSGLYDGAGFQCESCFFVACIPCGVKHIEDAHAI